MKLAPVSVIIPCYECSDTIERAVASVARQSHRPAELIMVDDASHDFTLQRLFEVQKYYGEEWIKVIPLESNSGPAAARNVGWKTATNKYLAFLDADDAWHSRKIEIQYTWMALHPDVVLTGHRCLLIRNNQVADLQLPENGRAFRVKPLSLLVSNKFHTRSVMLLRHLPYRFNTNKRFSEDYLLWLEIVLNGHVAWFLDLPMGYFYKALFGEGGLSKNLLNVEKGELDTYWRLHRQGLLSIYSMLCLTLLSLAKHLRRMLIKRLPSVSG
jgi:teichuronic acid biosynthesis glycosyltransferase TuaG